MRAIGLVLFFCAVYIMADPIPDRFFGRFKIDRSENFDEFLSGKGVGFFARQIIKLASVTKELTKGSYPGSYTLENLSWKKNVRYDFLLGEPFSGEALDSTEFEITFTFEDGEVTEHHARHDNPDITTETYHYTMSADNKELIMKMTNNGITCKRYFKRQHS
ncbi:hypothetical protein PMAYCL1PPCAC_32374 [Pristionchus mayeri]|uniref:Cytosolic fatty-acid binding proteins domain-containing protein n=1 Tax=Pristionchus mayeri TaxID=1317129 RepID=A0AAN5DFD4_9BILA|nr:hypothetical protein PMAYCL1PPCAC_32374 [Pristionchus mayeri]